ncbi:hypothetical protein BASA81_015603 [Batrachochytrium salamandrivorans]|nr:hypothetical protein BASA81_015603 [Batrachochytrium salamandrivorans]
MDSRQSLLWSATRARKKGLIDGKTFTTVQRLCKEPSTRDVELKITAFSVDFLARLAVLDPEFSPAHSASMPSASSPLSVLEQLPWEVCSREVGKFLTHSDLLSLAQTSFGVNVLFLPPVGWVGRILAALPLDTTLLPVLLQLFPANPTPLREEAIRLFAKGVAFLQLDGADGVGVANEVKRQYLLPRMEGLQIKLSSSLRGQSAGDAMTLLDFTPTRDAHVELLFKPTGSPPVVRQGDQQSQFHLHALSSDKRSISCVCNLFAQQRHGAYIVLQSLAQDANAVSGKASITLCGSRSAKWLGRITHNDEYHYQMEVMSTLNGGHGASNRLESSFREAVVMQTPRTVFKVPEGYYEVAPALGVTVAVPLSLLFAHCYEK